MSNTLKPFLFGVLATLSFLGFLTIFPAKASPAMPTVQNSPSATFNMSSRPGKSHLVTLSDDNSTMAINAKFVDKIEVYNQSDKQAEVHASFISDVTGESVELFNKTVTPKAAEKFLADINAAKN